MTCTSQWLYLMIIWQNISIKCLQLFGVLIRSNMTDKRRTENKFRLDFLFPGCFKSLNVAFNKYTAVISWWVFERSFLIGAFHAVHYTQEGLARGALTSISTSEFIRTTFHVYPKKGDKESGKSMRTTTDQDSISLPVCWEEKTSENFQITQVSIPERYMTHRSLLLWSSWWV